MAGNRLLMERADRDGSPGKGRLHMRRRVLHTAGDDSGNKPITNKSQRISSNKKSNGTPMKMLIAQEMSNGSESQQKPPSVVARLMGLDSLPDHKPVSTLQRSSPEGHKRDASSKLGSGPRRKLHDSSVLDMNHLSQTYSLEQPGYKDIYEIWQQSARSSSYKDQPRQREKSNDKRRMDLVRQKFIDAKRLATDENLRQSKEFQDALEVLSSNRDLLLKFLQEPNSLFSKSLYELQSIPPPPQTKRITVLKPTKNVDTERYIGPETQSEKHIKKQNQAFQLSERDSDWSTLGSSFAHQRVDDSYQPTRIVVLKPSPGKTNEIKTTVNSPSSSPRSLQSERFYGEYGSDALKGSRKIAKEITQKMRKSLSSDRIDENLLPFVSSNSYVRDESHRSEHEYMEEGNLSDSEVMTPTSRLSWDYNKYGSPYSTSSLGRASYTSESSVTREAKKRLSERLAMMTAGGSNLEQRQVRRTSSTLGEMLALSSSKTPSKIAEESNNEGPTVSSSRWSGEEQQRKGPRAEKLDDVGKDESEEHSPRSLSRSRSVPVTSMAYQKVGMNSEASDSMVSKSIDSEEVAKPKSSKSSFRGKVSSLFFSRSKKPSKEKSGSTASDSSQAGSQPSSTWTSPDIKQLSNRSSHELDCGTALCEEENSLSTSNTTIMRGTNQQTTCISEESLSPQKPELHEKSSNNQDQPSPISVLEVQFEDDANTSQSSEIIRGDHYELSTHSSQEPEPIASSSADSVARILSWDESSSTEASSPSVLDSSQIPSKAMDEQHWFMFVHALLLAAGLDHETSNTVFSKWHSPDSPLDPLLMEKFIDQKEDVQLTNEAKRRQRRSDYRLMFDCVNAALVEIVKCGLDAIPLPSASCKWVEPGSPVTDEVWIRVKEWVSAQTELSLSEIDSPLIVEREVKSAILGKRWVEMMGLEIDGIVKEIEERTVDEMVEEALVDFTCWLL